MKNGLNQLRSILNELTHDRSGLAVTEFAVSLPFFMGLTIAGIETANYASTVTQLNQIAIHAADGAARMGSGLQAQNKVISDADINDVFIGAEREGESLNINGLYAYRDPGTGAVSTRGVAKMFLSSIEPVATGFDAANPRYRMRWQRCTGKSTLHTASYGTPSTVTSVTGVGPATRQIGAPPNGATMFVELKYFYKPMIIGDFTKVAEQTITQNASMVVRDNRDYDTYNATSGIKPVTGVPSRAC